MSRNLRRAIIRRRQAEQRVADTLKRDYPVGATILFIPPGSRKQTYGIVLAHGTGDRVMVRNGATGRDSWILAWSIAVAA